MSIMMRLKKGLWLLALAVFAASGARGASNGNGTLNYALTENASASYVYDVVVDNGVDKRLVSSAAFSAKDMTLSASPTLKIPASDTLPAGTKIKITEIEFCRNSQNDANAEGVYVTINGVTSDERVVGGGYSSSLGIGASGNLGSGTGVKITYAFSSVCEIAVDTSYTIGFLDGNQAAKTTVKYCYVSNTGSSDVVAQSLLNLDGDTPVLFKLKGTVDYTFNAAGETLDLDVGANWVSGKKPSSTQNARINATADTTLAGSLTAANVYITGSSVVTASAATTLSGTIKGDGKLMYSGVQPTIGTGGITGLTIGDWTGTLILCNIGGLNNNSQATTQLNNLASLGNAASKVQFTNVKAYYPDAASDCDYTLVLKDGSDATDYAWVNNNGYSNYNSGKGPTFKALEGDGTFYDDKGVNPPLKFKTAVNFTGVFTISDAGHRILIGENATKPSVDYYGSITIGSDATVTVKSGKTWTAKNGMIVNGTLKAESGATVPTITTSDTASYVMSANATIGSVSGSKLASSLFITAGTLTVADTSITSLTIPAAVGTTYYNLGTLDLFGCTALTALYLDLGACKTFDMTKLVLPSGCTVYANVGSARDLSGYSISGATYLVEETKAEYGAGFVTVENVPAGVSVFVKRYSGGAIVTATVDGTTATLSGNAVIDGAATDIDWDFTDGTDDAMEQAPSGMGKNQDSTLTFYVDANDSTKTGVYIKHHPYTSGAASWFTSNSAAMTVAVVGTMPATKNTIFLNFGSAYANKYGLLIATTANADEVLIGYNYGGTVTPITTMTVPNASTARHSYIVTKVDGTTATTFTVYLDGTKWKTVTTDAATLGTASDVLVAFTGNESNGIQVGSDYGGNIRQAGYAAASDDVGVLNVLRAYGRIITQAEIDAYAAAFPYDSPSGKSTRTFTAASENWIDETGNSAVWTNTKSGGASGTPDAGAQLEVTASAASAQTIDVNLAAQASYESLLVEGSQTVTFELADGYTGAIAPGKTTIKTPVVVKPGVLNLHGGPTFVEGNGHLTFDYSGYTMTGTSAIELTGQMDQNDVAVTIVPPADGHYTYTYGYSGTQYIITPAVAVAVLNHGGTLKGYTTIDAAMADAVSGDTVTLQTAYLTPSTAVATYAGDKTGVNVVVKGYTIAPVVADGATTWTTPSAYVWTGEGADTNWTTPANWGLASGYPGSSGAANSQNTDNVLVPSAATITLTGSAYLTGVTLSGNLTLTGGGTLYARTISGSKVILSGATLRAYQNGKTNDANSLIVSSDVEIADSTENGFYMGRSSDNNYSTKFELAGALTGTGKVTVTISRADYQGITVSGDASQFAGEWVVSGSGDATQFSAATQVSGTASYTFNSRNNGANGSYPFNLSGGSFAVGALNGTIYSCGGSNRAHGMTITVGGRNEDCSFGGSIGYVSSYCNNLVKTGTADMTYTGGGFYGSMTIQNGTYIIGSTDANPGTIIFQGGALSVAEGITVDPSSHFSSASTAAVVFDDRGYDNEWATALTATTAPHGLTKKGSGTLTLKAVPTYTGTTTVEAGVLEVPQGTTISELALTGGKIAVALEGAVSDTTVLTVTALADGTTLTADDIVLSDASTTLTLDTESTPGSVIVKATREVKNYVWTGATSTAFDTLSNWLVNNAVPTEAPYASIDTIEFPADGAPWTVALSGDVEIKSVAVNGAVTLTGGKLLANAFTGSAAITLGGNAGIGDYEPAADITIANPIAVSGTGNSLNANTKQVTYSGAISSADDNAELTLYGAVERLNLTGDNSGLKGTVYMNGHVTLASSNAGSASAKWVIANTTGDYDNPIRANSVQFGELSGTYTHVKAAMNDYTHSMYVGALGTSFTLGGKFSDNNSGRAETIYKVGAGTMTFTGRYVNWLNLNEGTVYVTSTDGTVVHNGVAFNGGVLQLASGVVQDFSAKVQSSTAAVKVGVDDGASLTWGTALNANNTVAEIEKYGAGTLTLTYAPAWDSTKVTVAAGSLVMPDSTSVTFGENTIVSARDTTAGTMTLSHATTVALTVPEVDGASVQVTAGGETIEVSETANVYIVPVGVPVTVTYTAMAANMVVTGGVITVTANEAQSVDTTGVAIQDTAPRTWTGNGGDHNWSTPANWDNGVPTAFTPVVFPAGDWTVYVWQDTDRAASVTLNGNVTLSLNENQTDWSGIGVAGDVTGTGTLTLWRSGVNSYSGSATTISCPLVVKANSSDSFLQKVGFNVTGTVEVNSLLVVYDATTFSGAVTLNNGAVIRSSESWYNNGVDAPLTFSGTIALPANATASFERNSQTITGAVTLGAGATFTLSSGTTATAATFTLGNGASLVVPSGATVTPANIAVADSTQYEMTSATENGTTTYTASLKNYTITWIVDETETTTTVQHGATPSYGENNPVKAFYTFTGWTPQVVAATEDATYTAQFTRSNVAVTVPEVTGATVSVTYTDANGVEQTATAAGTYTVQAGTTVTATYTAVEDYAVTSGTVTLANVDGATATLNVSGVGAYVVAETWTGEGGDGKWTTAANWSHGVVPSNVIAVTFPAGTYEVTVSNVGWDPWAGRDKCGAMTINGDLTLKNENSGEGCHLAVFGNITGTGSLTLSHVGLDNGTWDPAATLNITCPLYIAGSGTSWFVNRDIGFNVTSAEVWGNLDSWAPSAFGTLTIKDNAAITIGTSWTDENQVLHQKGVVAQAIIVAAGKSATFNYSGTTTASDLAINGAVTLGAGASITYPSSATIGAGASFAAPEGYYVAETTGEGTVTKTATYKPVATVTVGENVTLSGVVNGAAFAPGDTITLTVTPATYYTASVTVTGATYANGVVTVGTTDFTIEVTATRNQVTFDVPTAANATAVVTVGGDEYTTGSVTIDEGSTVSVVWTAASGYGIVSGGTQTIENFTSASTFTAPVVEEKTASFSDVAFVYSGYNKATVYAQVSYTGEQPAFTMTVGGVTYTGVYSATDPRNAGLNMAPGLATTSGYVTFSDVAVGDSGSALSYTLSTEGATSSYAASTYVGDVTSGWIAAGVSEGVATATGGAWTTAPTVTDGKLDVSYNTFNATTASAGEVVTINFTACFSEINTEDVSGSAPQAAVKIGSVNDTATFMVWDGAYGTGAFRPVAGVTPDVETEYAVVVTLNYLTGKYTVTVDGTALCYTGNNETVTEFTIGDSTATSISSIGFEGAGQLASMTGDYYTVYAAQDANGTKYKTIAEAVAAIEAGTATEPVTVLHTQSQSSYPTLWGVDATTGKLTTTAVAKVVTPGEDYDTSAFYATLQAAINAAVASEEAGVQVVVLNAITEESVTLANEKSVTIDFGSQTKMAPVCAGETPNAYKITETPASDSADNTVYTYTATAWATYTITLTAPNATVTGIADGGTVSEANPVVTFTVAAAQYYTLGDVTATPAGGEAAPLTAVEGTYTYTLAADTTFAVAATRDTVTLTIPPVENATATVTVDDVAQTAAASYTVNAGSKVVVTWTAATNYRIESGATETIDPIDKDTIAASPTVVMDVASFTIAVPANTIVKVDGQVYTAGEAITKTIGTKVTITYEASGAYVAGGTTTQTITVAGNTGTVAAPVDYTSTAAVAQVGDAYYATLAGAVADGAGKTVTLLQNVTLDSRIEPNASMTIDLGGKTITRTGTTGNGSAFDVKSGNVTIKNGVIDCTQDDTAIAADGVYAITARSGSNVTLEGLTVTVNSECGACAYPFAGATLIINSGTYANNTTTPYRYNTAITGMAINQPNVADQLVFINGGTFSQVDPMYGDDAQLMKNFCSPGYIAVQDSENSPWGVVEGYVITFANDDGTVLETYRVEKGDTPVYDGDTPEKAATAQYSYTFASWSPTVEAATATATYTAQFTSTLNKYTIVFVDEDGETVLKAAAEYDYGTAAADIVLPAETPVKESTVDKVYTFAGWQPVVADVTGNATYAATYNEAVRTYAITWNVEGVETVDQVAYGTVPVYNGAVPVKQYFTFAGWNTTPVAVTGDAVYTATFTRNTVVVTVPDVANTTKNVAATLDDKTVEVAADGNNYTVPQGATVTVTYTAGDEYELAASGTVEITATEATTVDTASVTTQEKATTYTWASAASAPWETAGSWTYGDNKPATRAPGALDTVNFADGAKATISSAVSVKKINARGAVALSAAVDGASLTVADELSLGAVANVDDVLTLESLQATFNGNVCLGHKAGTAQAAGSAGTLVLDGCTTVIAGELLIVRENYADGTLTVDGGTLALTHTSQDMVVGLSYYSENSGGTGTFNITGGASVTCASKLCVAGKSANNAKSSCKGVLNVVEGTLTVNGNFYAAVGPQNNNAEINVGGGEGAAAIVLNSDLLARTNANEGNTDYVTIRFKKNGKITASAKSELFGNLKLAYDADALGGETAPFASTAAFQLQSATAKVDVEVPANLAVGSYQLATWASLSNNSGASTKPTLTIDGTPVAKYTLGDITAKGIALTVEAITLTVPAAGNGTYTVTVDEVDVTAEGDKGVYTVPLNSTAVVTYAPASGYKLGTGTLVQNFVMDESKSAEAPVFVKAGFYIHVAQLPAGVKIASVTANGQPVEAEEGSYYVDPDAEVVVTYANDGAYVLSTDSTTFTAEADVTLGVDYAYPTATAAVAQIDSTYYATLAEAVATAVAGDTVALIADASGAGVFVAANAGKNITIDLGGRTYTCSGPAVGSTGTQNQAFHLEKGNTITIRNGTISSTSDSGVIMLVQNYANLTLDDVTLDGANLPGTGRYVLSTNNGSTTINDTTITAKKGDIAFDACTGWGSYTANSVTVTGDSLINGDVEVSFYGTGMAPTLTLTGGTMTGEIKMAQGAGEATVVKADTFTQDAPADYKWVDNGNGTATLAAKMYVAQVGQTKYESLEEAVAEAAAGDSVTLLADIPLAATIAIAKDLTIDLGGHNITATDCRAIWVKGGDVAIAGEGEISTVVTAGTALASSSSVIRVGSNDAPAGFTLGEDATVTSDYCYGVTYFGTRPQTVVIDGTVAVTGSQAALSGNGSSGLASTTLTVNGTVSATQDYAIYNPQQGETTLNGTITGLGGIEVKAGTVNINGGTITATAQSQSHAVNNNGTSTTGYAIASIGNASYAGGTGGNVVINGGTISGKAIVLKENNAENLGTVTAMTDAIVTESNQEWKETDTEGVYELVVKTFTIVWKNDDGTVLETDKGVEYGATPEYNGTTPAKDPAGGYTYEFARWSPEIVAATADAIYTAQFTEIAADRIPVAVADLASGSTQIIAVPVQEAGATVTAASLISTDNRAAGDTLKVFDKATGRYNSWVLAETEGALVWTATTVIVADDNGSETSYTSPEADTVTLTPGEGVWVTVDDASKPLQLQGKYAGDVKSPIVVTKGYNLVAPPPKSVEATGFVLADFDAPTNPGDRIVIPTGGAPISCQYKASRGGWYYAKPTSDGGVDYVNEITVPAGTGFWYVTGDAEKEIEL